MNLTKINAKPTDYSKILTIWEKSVQATHDFLSQTDQEFFKEAVPKFFTNLEILLWFDEDNLIGFTATTSQELEMFFLDPVFIGKGYGSQILKWLVEYKEINRIDVNKQNKQATKFYQKHGFKIDSESQRDGYGKPYPILHLIKI